MTIPCVPGSPEASGLEVPQNPNSPDASGFGFFVFINLSNKKTHQLFSNASYIFMVLQFLV